MILRYQWHEHKVQWRIACTSVVILRAPLQKGNIMTKYLCNI
jgi:hypothetical protein